jgi:hypothetical protein
MKMGGIAKSAATTTVRAKPKAIKKLKAERPHASVTGKTGSESDASNVKAQRYSSGMSKNSRGKYKPKTIESATQRTLAMRDRAHSQIQDLTIPDASPGEREYLDEYRRIFDTLKEISIISEANYFKNPTTREIYALATVYSQIREVIADIRSISDMSDQANALIGGVVQPSISSIAQAFVDTFYHVRILIREIAREDEVQYGLRKVDELMRDQGLMLQDQYQNVAQRISELLVSPR